MIREGDRILDIGSGSGTDTLIASTLTGPRGKVYGLDMTRAMLDKLRRNIAAMGSTNVEPIEGTPRRSHCQTLSWTSSPSNGVLNLVPDKPRAFAEITRVLKPGGRLQIADISLATPVSDKARADPKLWG